MRKILSLLFLFLLLTIFSQSVSAATKKPAAKPAKQTSTDAVITAAVAKDKSSVTIYFGNLIKVNSVTYSLGYTTNGKSEGVGGELNTSGKFSLSRTLLFGTCSSGVCRYHGGIKNAKVTVQIVYKNGKRQTKVIPLNVSGATAKTVKTTIKKPIKKPTVKPVSVKKSSKK